jgi:hypothetical protein
VVDVVCVRHAASLSIGDDEYVHYEDGGHVDDVAGRGGRGLGRGRAGSAGRGRGRGRGNGPTVRSWDDSAQSEGEPAGAEDLPPVAEAPSAAATAAAPVRPAAESTVVAAAPPPAATADHYPAHGVRLASHA